MSDYVPSRQQFLWCFRLFSIVSSTRSASPPTVPSTEIVNGHPGSSNRCRGSTLSISSEFAVPSAPSSEVIGASRMGTLACHSSGNWQLVRTGHKPVYDWF
ncbi:hypothetical protein EDD17DRAFT_1900115 [Pisolithus thermaeus]|nr:hypothetical protein EDD17DRAFT_1900115 [Pisolithus thermaeus]